MRLFLLVLAAAACLTATAQLCTPALNGYGYSYVVDSQAVLDEIAGRCTAINGSLHVAHNYTGSFYLPNVRNISGWVASQYELDFGRPAPTSLNLPDLEYLGAFYLGGLPSLGSLSIPKLKTLRRRLHAYHIHEVDLRSLDTAADVSLCGEILSLRLDSLREVTEIFKISNRQNCRVDIPPATPLHIFLPSLQMVGEAKFDGMILSLHVPNLTTIAGHGDVITKGLKFSTEGGRAVNLTFPRLSYSLGPMSLEGDIGSLSMPNLRNMSLSSLYIDSYNPLAINLPFDEAQDIVLQGDISSVQFPNLKYLSYDFIVNSNLPLDCDSVRDTASRASNRTGGTGGTGVPPTIICRSSVELDRSGPRKGLSTGAKIAIGVVVGVVGLTIVLGALFFLRRRGKRQQLASESSVQLQESTPPASTKA